MVAQCLGAICGVGLVKAFMKAPYKSLGGGANSVAPGYHKGSALGAEIMGTFALVYTVLSTTDPRRGAHDVCITCTFGLVRSCTYCASNRFACRFWVHWPLGSLYSWLTQPLYPLLEPGSTQLGALVRLLFTTMKKFGMIM